MTITARLDLGAERDWVWPRVTLIAIVREPYGYWRLPGRHHREGDAVVRVGAEIGMHVAGTTAVDGGDPLDRHRMDAQRADILVPWIRGRANYASANGGPEDRSGGRIGWWWSRLHRYGDGDALLASTGGGGGQAGQDHHGDRTERDPSTKPDHGNTSIWYIGIGWRPPEARTALPSAT